MWRQRSFPSLPKQRLSPGSDLRTHSGRASVVQPFWKRPIHKASVFAFEGQVGPRTSGASLSETS
jgi:hypothetical protein